MINVWTYDDFTGFLSTLKTSIHFAEPDFMGFTQERCVFFMAFWPHPGEIVEVPTASRSQVWAVARWCKSSPISPGWAPGPYHDRVPEISFHGSWVCQKKQWRYALFLNHKHGWLWSREYHGITVVVVDQVDHGITSVKLWCMLCMLHGPKETPGKNKPSIWHKFIGGWSDDHSSIWAQASNILRYQWCTRNPCISCLLVNPILW